MLKIGIVAESKNPPDRRVPITPAQAAILQMSGNFQFFVEPSDTRCYTDQEYLDHSIIVQSDLSNCDILLGVKEIKTNKLIPGKTYLFFSHTIKKQPYNKEMLQDIISKNIRLVDYELLTDDQNQRVAAFGYFAGMVGAHNGLFVYGKRSGKFTLPRMYQSFDYNAVKSVYSRCNFPPIKIVLTGKGRVANGALEVLKDMGIRQVDPSIFLKENFEFPVFTQLGTSDYYQDEKGNSAERTLVRDHPEKLRSAFGPYTEVADLLLHGIFWTPEYPAFFTVEQMQSTNFKIKVIADLACDIAPESSIPCTLRASTIESPVYGYDPFLNKEIAPFQSSGTDVMAIDNLPSELPRDASEAFGKQLLASVLPEFLDEQKSAMLNRATICDDGKLMPDFMYLSDFVAI